MQPHTHPIPSRHLVLIGLRASGKSTVGAMLAREFGLPFVDLDDETARILGARTAGEAFTSAGEPAFRSAESEALRETLRCSPRVIALGGGTPTAPGAADLLRSTRDSRRAYVVFLDPPLDALAERLTKHDGGRPSLTGRGVVEEIEEIAARRRPLYAALADLVVGREEGRDLGREALPRDAAPDRVPALDANFAAVAAGFRAACRSS